MPRGLEFLTPGHAPVLAQAWRGGSRQALLSRLLAGCDTEALDDTRVGATGALAARSATTDIARRASSRAPCAAAT